MWVLTHIETGQRLYILTNKSEYTVGRDNADLIVADDLSVSREHATIQCLATCIKVLDTNSKYGVFINGGIETTTVIAKNKPVRLEVGDTVRFGRAQAIFRVEKIDVKVCTSTLDETEATQLKSLLQLVGGKVENNWSTNCTHLVMPVVTITIKLLQSLAHCTPVVTPEYFVQYVQNAQTNQNQLPDVNDFVPDIGEPFIKREPQMMHVHLERQRLFQNKTFVFMVKRQMSTFKPVIELAGGKCANLQEDRIRRQLLLKTDYIPVQHTSSSNSQSQVDVSTMADYINQSGRRLISDTEIGLSIIHRSIERFCNPDHKMLSAFDVGSSTASELHANALIGATPHLDTSHELEVDEVHVAETIEDNTEESNNNDLIIIDIEKPSTSTTDLSIEMPAPSSRRVTRRSAEQATAAHKENESTTSKRKSTETNNSVGSKRKHNDSKESIDPQEPGPSKAVAPSKKQKLSESSELNDSSTSSQSSMSRVKRVSGFISTQNRFKHMNKNGKPPLSEHAQPQQNENPSDKRKRVVSLLISDDDEDENDDESSDNLFCFSRKQAAKRSKSNAKQANTLTLNSDDDGDDNDDGDGNLFNFGTSQAQSKTKQMKKNTSNASKGHDTTASGAQDSFKKPYQYVFNRSTFIPFTTPRAEKVSAEWITANTEKLNLNKQSTTSAIRIKQEKLDECEMTDADRKRYFLDSVRNGFEKRSINIDQSRCDRRRQEMVDETDNVSINHGDSTLNRSKNFKCFVKKIHVIQRKDVIKSNLMPVIISSYARL